MIGKMYAGEDRYFDLSFVDSAGAPFSLTGWGITVTIGLGSYGTVTKVIGSGVTLNPQSGATLGTAVCKINDSDTAAVSCITNASFVVTLASPSGDDSLPILDTLIVRPAA